MLLCFSLIRYSISYVACNQKIQISQLMDKSDVTADFRSVASKSSC